MFAVVQIVSLDGWSRILENLQVVEIAPILPAIYCISLIFLGKFLTMDLNLAIIV
jgi:hypothetical protein